MKWKVVRASITGTSHVKNRIPCQDTCKAGIIEHGNKNCYLVAIVSDGAGSAIKGGDGSALTCKTLFTSISSSLEQHQDATLCENSVKEWIRNTRRKIDSLANENNLTARDYACTVLGTVIGQNSALFFQIGDGAIVVSKFVSKPDVQGIVFWPDSGEYVNTTFFITDENAISTLRITKVDSRIDEVCLLSDGLQHLALSYHQKTPHFPFFDPMLDVMRKIKTNVCDDLNEKLKRFLNSAQINSRTDDDKTLVLATRINL